MMATEANQSKSVDAAITSSEPTITINADDSQNVDSKPPLVNGASASSDDIENKQLSDIVDDLVNSAEVSISGGSDTEASKNDGTTSKNGDKGHARTSSAVKKPATFKSVSVNKTFLGSKASIPGAPTKPGDKTGAASPLSAGQSSSSTSSAAARPRFVAKFGSGLRDGGKASANSNGKAAGTPDPSAVWNKNRPPPPPEPKKFTDEELKKYGIHMANRLAPDDARGPGNWADIDDDDDDWIPGEIQWNDGTKVTIPQVDESVASPIPAPAVPEQTSAPVSVPGPAATSAPPAPKEVKPIEKPKSPAPSSSPSVKPGVLVSGKGLVLKGAPEKPTLVARPPAPPAPIKSPWATLPPIEKASPIAMDTPAAQASGRPPLRDGPIAKSMTPPPAKEIAADDFSRSSGPMNPNRELFNSQSGRYEPVNDRRGAGRSEAYSRHPAAVLQRPSQSEGPAEPSAAFQTTRTSGQDAPYGRRRGSSNVSGGSGTFMQRFAKPHDHGLPPPDVMNMRRESFTAGSDSPVSPRNFSPSGGRQHGTPWHTRTSPRPHYTLPHQPQQDHQLLGPPGPPGPQGPPSHMAQAPPPPAPVPRGPTEDEFQIQKRLMTEKRELARQRKLEEEARLEAEKQKRIAAKLAAMGPAPESRSAKQAAAKEEATGSTPTLASAVPATQSLAHSASQAQEQPNQQQQQKLDHKPAPTSQKPDGDRSSAEPTVNGGSGAGDGRPSQSPSGAESKFTSTQEGKSAQPWQGQAAPQTDRFSWGSGTQSSSSRIWGAPNNNNRGLGNGTFISDLGRISDTYPQAVDPMSTKARPGPGPIGPPGGNKTYSDRPKPIGPPKATTATTDQAQRPSAVEDERSRWINATIASDEKAATETRDRLFQQKRDMDSRGVVAEEARPTYHDSWKPVKFDADGRRIESKDRVQVVHNSAWKPSAVEETTQQAPALTQPPTVAAGPTTASPAQSRGSRFFPSRDVRLESPAPPSQDLSRPQSPSPPPPDTVGHPAFDGDATHPHVALPPSRPVVRLPPPTSAQAAAAQVPMPPPASTAPAQPFGWASPSPFKDAASATQGPARAHPGAAVQQPQQHQPPASMWQDRIHHLLHDGKPTAHPKAMTVEPSSKGALESGHAHPLATVSLPTFLVTVTDDDGAPTSKGMAEECFEEQEMGSLPPVRIPTTVAEAAWHPATPPAKPFPRRLVVAATTIDLHEEARPSQVNVLIPGMARAKVTLLPISVRSYSNSRRSNRPRNSSARHSTPGPQGSHRGPGNGSSGSSGNGNRSRDPSVSYSHDNGSMRRSGSGSGSASGGPGSNAGVGSNSTPTGRGRGGGGGFRRGADWSRRASTPVQT